MRMSLRGGWLAGNDYLSPAPRPARERQRKHQNNEANDCGTAACHGLGPPKAGYGKSIACAPLVENRPAKGPCYSGVFLLAGHPMAGHGLWSLEWSSNPPASQHPRRKGCPPGKFWGHCMVRKTQF
jgi:hypothetical protein